MLWKSLTDNFVTISLCLRCGCSVVAAILAGASVTRCHSGSNAGKGKQ